MKLHIQYDAIYQYDEPVSLSPHLGRLFPRNSLTREIRKITFRANASADVQYRTDLYDNQIAYCFFPAVESRLEFDLEIDLLAKPTNPFHFLLDSHALSLPLRSLGAESDVLSPFLHAAPLPDLAQELRPDLPRPTVEALVTMTQWMFENIAYERREEGEPFAPEETLKRRSGACRDTAVLFARILRLHGVASRLVSGFLYEPPSETERRVADSAMHAWVEAYLPGAGWLGIDPTNGVLCDHLYIATAVGRTPDDISPIKGTYYGKRTIPSTLETKLDITES